VDHHWSIETSLTVIFYFRLLRVSVYFAAPSVE